MKTRYYLPAALLLLAACNKSGSDAGPKSVATGFGQDFTLQYRQEATLPPESKPELTVLLEELDYRICPKNARCFLPDLVSPTLAITAADGQTQRVLLPSSDQQQISSSLPPDTTSIRANGRRYVVYYKDWGGDYDRDKLAKKDFRLTFRLEKP